MPNLFAYAALFVFPIVVVVLFRSMSKPSAVIWSVVLGYLFLPERTGIDLPMLPEYNKVLVPSLFALLMVLIVKEPRASRANMPVMEADDPPTQRRRRTGRGSPILRSRLATVLLIVLVFIVPVGVFLTNTDPVSAGPNSIQGMSLYDAASMVLNTTVMLLPFLLGRYVLHSPEAQTTLLKVIALSGVAYSFLILFEVRMSPQLHTWIYGFFQHEFIQHIRTGGYRPIVFLSHGLAVAMYMAIAVLAAAYLCQSARHSVRSLKVRQKAAIRYGLMLIWLLVALAFVRSLGALMIALAFLPVILFLSRRKQITIALTLSLMIGFYPVLRQANLFPVDMIFSFAASINEQRADSLGARLYHEDALLYKAQERPVFGWGGYGRNRLYDERTGYDLSTTDGQWVIAFSSTGWIGYIAQFGLLILPVILLFRRRNNQDITPATYGLALILTANLIDLIPNSSLTPVTWLIAGALLGATERAPVLKAMPHKQRNRPQNHVRTPTRAVSRT